MYFTIQLTFNRNEKEMVELFNKLAKQFKSFRVICSDTVYWLCWVDDKEWLMIQSYLEKL